jgi:peptidoglycan/LPS O-acetylase OafA/YrhL
VLKPDYLNNTTADLEHLIKSLFFIPFNKNGAGHYPILFLGWTLNFEIIFYLLFGMCLFISKKYRFVLCSISLIFFYLYCNFMSNKNFVFLSYANTMLFEFIFGMVAFVIWNKFNKKIKISLLINLIFLILFLTIVTIFLNSSLPPFISHGVPAFLLVIFFLFSLNDYKFPKILITLGDASYCIYLLHPYIIQFFYKVFDISNYNIFIQLINVILISLVIFLVSIFIFEFLERPINKKLKEKFNF